MPTFRSVGTLTPYGAPLPVLTTFGACMAGAAQRDEVRQVVGLTAIADSGDVVDGEGSAVRAVALAHLVAFDCFQPNAPPLPGVVDTPTLRLRLVCVNDHQANTGGVLPVPMIFAIASGRRLPSIAAYP